MKHILELKNVSKSYKSGSTSTVAIKDISFSLDEKESLAIIGPSGSGKTTLLNMIGGLDKPSKGMVLIDGKDVSKMNDGQLSKFRNKTIGFIFQFFNLQDYLRAEENVMIPLLLAGVKYSVAQQKAVQLLEKVGLANRVKYYPKQLSGGELQRVAVARSLANDPKILLADEPTANLDRASANTILELFEDIGKNGVSVVVITHDPLVSNRFENVLHIADGEIKEHLKSHK